MAIQILSLKCYYPFYKGVIGKLLFNLLIYLKFESLNLRLNFFDNPDGRLKKHSKPVSLVGGLIILINIYLIVFLINLLNLESLLFEKNYLFLFLFLITFFYIIGALDDLKNINPNKKLLLIFLVLVICIFVFPEIKQNSLIPTVNKFSKICWINGFISIQFSFNENMGAISFGSSLVNGRSLVPLPPQVIIAFNKI